MTKATSFPESLIVVRLFPSTDPVVSEDIVEYLDRKIRVEWSACLRWRRLSKGDPTVVGYSISNVSMYKLPDKTRL